MIKKGIYIIEFDDEKEMEKVSNSEFDGVTKRCLFKNSMRASVYTHKDGYFKLILGGYLPKYIGS